MNMIRNEMVRKAVEHAQSRKLPINVRTVSMFLPGPTAFNAALRTQENFALDDDDLAPYIAAEKPGEFTPRIPLVAAPQEPQPQPVEHKPEDAAALARRLATVEKARPEPPKLTAQQANEAIHKAEDRLSLARINFNVARQNTMKARGALANAITVWQTGLPAYTTENLIRDHINAEQARRKERIENGRAPSQPSYIDRAAKYGRDNTPEGAVRARMQRGSHRGAFPGSAQHQINHDPARGPVGK